MVYSFNEADAADRHDVQYFEMFCNRGIYHQGLDGGDHSTPWAFGAKLPASTTTPGSCTAPMTGPKRTTWLPNSQASWPSCSGWAFLLEAGKYNVFPLDDRRVERFNADLAGRPSSSRGTASCCSAAWAG